MTSRCLRVGTLMLLLAGMGLQVVAGKDKNNWSLVKNESSKDYTLAMASAAPLTDAGDFWIKEDTPENDGKDGKKMGSKDTQVLKANTNYLIYFETSSYTASCIKAFKLGKTVVVFSRLPVVSGKGGDNLLLRPEGFFSDPFSYGPNGARNKGGLPFLTIHN